LPIIRELLQRSQDVDDPQIPLLLWWAIEDKSISDRGEVAGLLASASAWQAPLIRKHIIERLARRYAAEDSTSGFDLCAHLLNSAPGPEEIKLVVSGLDKALEGRRLEKTSPALSKAFNDLWNRVSPDLTLIRLGLRLSYTPARGLAFERMGEATIVEADRISLIEALGQTGPPDCVPPLLRLLASSKPKVQSAALNALQNFSDPRIARAMLDQYASLNGDNRARARTALASRPAWAVAWVQAVEAGQFDPKEIQPDQLRQMIRHNHAPLTALIEKRWGKLQSDSPEEKKNTINQLRLVLKPSGTTHRDPADPVEGKRLFQKSCGICHSFFGEGNNIGPELTGADRKNTEWLLANIVDPSSYIRAEYVSHNAEMKDGRTLSGLIAESTPQTVTLLDAQNQRTVLNRADIKDLAAASVSLMPDGILEALTQQQVRDLFSYLQSDGAKKN
jgi:putative heme-binding domain-containing protein